MGTIHASLAPSTKVDSQWRPPGKGPHDDIEVRLAYGLIHMPVLTDFLAGITLKEIRVTAVEGGWRVMLKGKRGKEHKVAFFAADTLRGALMEAVTTVDINYTEWHPDRFPPKT